MKRDELIPVDVVVTLWLKPDANVTTVLLEMDYDFRHGDDIVDMELVYINTDI
jgi:hypothetical protein